MIDLKYFRNPELRLSLFFYIIFTFIFTSIGFIIGWFDGLLILIICVLFSLAHFVVTCHRYSKIENLSNEIDSILHGRESIKLGEYSEGELAILQNEIAKLTVQLRDQSEDLRKDKKYLDDSIADISHQIRTPLTSINLIISFLSKSNLSDERRSELVNELEMLLSRIDWLISALLKISKLDAGTANLKKENVNVAELIKRSITPITIPMELREQRISIQMDGDEAYVGDLGWSVEAIGNILKNCMEHTPNGGEINIVSIENALYTEIAIWDNGSGIDKADLPHLFERFYKGRNSSDQSVGIGLALARMIITDQNGTIKVENLKECGAKFSIKFYKSSI